MSVQAAAAATHRRFLVCPPDYFTAHYLFNPFMTYRERVDVRRAKRQWRSLVRVLEDAGAELEIVEPDGATSAIVFTADGAFCYAPGHAVVLRNDGVRGDLEPPVFKAWLEERGYRTEALPPRYRLDGGNLLRLSGGDVLAGLKPGATELGERYLARLLRLTTGRSLHTVPLVDQRHLHLDTALAVLSRGEVLVYRGALREGELPAAVAERAEDVIEVTRADAARFACNVVCVGDVVVTGPVSERLASRIVRCGYAVERVDLGEFYKAGGGAKCLTLPLP